jgi:hypothetical protein
MPNQADVEFGTRRQAAVKGEIDTHARLDANRGPRRRRTKRRSARPHDAREDLSEFGDAAQTRRRAQPSHDGVHGQSRIGREQRDRLVLTAGIADHRQRGRQSNRGAGHPT